MPTNYSRGRAFEWSVRKQFEKGGCFVMRSAGSRGPFDLIAIERYVEGCEDEWQMFGVVCKKDGRLPDAERKLAVKVGRGHNISPLLYWKDKDTGKLRWKHLRGGKNG